MTKHQIEVITSVERRRRWSREEKTSSARSTVLPPLSAWSGVAAKHPLGTELHEWLRAERATLSRSSPVGESIDYMLKRWDGFTAFLSDGRVCLTNNAAERAPRGFVLGRKAWLFAGSDRGAYRAAFMASVSSKASHTPCSAQRRNRT
ncbi:hypothetical protein ABIE78_002701 [Sinorhizobium fredii]|uniref:Uncharacterized protein y4hP n=1 Tax=Sinorhizobium fredii (strain USDA 257) TaxID=1185652 RepID=I3X6G1_SINF2|nr:uncharacterized protein y4hP [Sinorhizobium fredii USDA 257]